MQSVKGNAIVGGRVRVTTMTMIVLAIVLIKDGRSQSARTRAEGDSQEDKYSFICRNNRIGIEAPTCKIDLHNTERSIDNFEDPRSTELGQEKATNRQRSYTRRTWHHHRIRNSRTTRAIPTSRSRV